MIYYILYYKNNNIGSKYYRFGLTKFRTLAVANESAIAQKKRMPRKEYLLMEGVTESNSDPEEVSEYAYFTDEEGLSYWGKILKTEETN